MNNTTSVSCMCLTYGRPHLVEEAIKCFLDQDYSGPKELIVLNDLDSQELVFNHHDVKIVNLKDRFNTVGEKRNACARYCSGDLLFVWDDDDIYLPWRITLSVNKIGDARYFKCNRAWTYSNKRLGGPAKNLFHSASCFTRELFEDAGGYDNINSGQDLTLENKFTAMKERPIAALTDEELYYIYRWQGTESFHLSAFGMDNKRRQAINGAQKCEMYVRKGIKEGTIPTGQINLAPSYRKDYRSLINNRIVG